jgi:hypothetical protein
VIPPVSGPIGDHDAFVAFAAAQRPERAVPLLAALRQAKQDAASTACTPTLRRSSSAASNRRTTRCRFPHVQRGAYLDVAFFHPLNDGNARAAMITLYFLLAREQIVLGQAAQILRVSKRAGNLAGALNLARLIGVLIGRNGSPGPCRRGHADGAEVD